MLKPCQSDIISGGVHHPYLPALIGERFEDWSAKQHNYTGQSAAGGCLCCAHGGAPETLQHCRPICGRELVTEDKHSYGAV